MQKIKIIIAGYIATIVFLSLYSFTQVDLGLTLTRHPFWLPFQQFFQHIGYFDRPLSTNQYIVIIALLFAFYFLILNSVHKKFITEKTVWWLVLLSSIILLFSYNAFSYDLFNYIFDARIVTHYQQNPYLQKALDYPGDPMLGFMHWTHRLYPYGPVWLALTVPLSYFGFGFFLPTLILFKILIAGSFLGTVYFIGKISKKISTQNQIFNILFFALNPLVIIESLVSAHNDMVMMFLAVVGIYFLLEKKYIFSFIFLGLSIGIKFGTVFLVPIFLYVFILDRMRKTIQWETIFLYASLAMSIGVIFPSLRTELQPWYFLWIIPFATFISQKRWVFIASWVFSLVLLLYYVPFLYTGNWDPPIPTIKIVLLYIGIIFSVCFSIMKTKKVS